MQASPQNFPFEPIFIIQLISHNKQMSITNSYLAVSPPASRPTGTSKSKAKGCNQYEFYNNEYKKRNASLIDIYAIEATELQSKEITPYKTSSNERRKVKSLPHARSTIRSGLVVENTHHQRVDKTIDSVNDYAEQLRITLLKQYKLHKMKSLRGRKAKGADEPLTSATQIQAMDQMVETKNAVEKGGSKEGSKHPAYKTLNLLYEAIIDNSFKRRKKDEFQLQAVHLPMVDRFNNRTQTLRVERELNFKCKMELFKKSELSLPHAQMENSYYPAKTKTTPRKINWIKPKSEAPLQEIGIFPWATGEQNLFD